MKEIPGGVTAPSGFMASGIHCGIKESAKDLGLIVSMKPASAAAVFTTNLFQAAPVRISAENIKCGKAQSIIINSGNANACTGEKGYETAKKIISLLADRLNIPCQQVLLASTGIIGVQLPHTKIMKALPELIRSLSIHGGRDFSEAIMTTDTFTKNTAVQYTYDNETYAVGGVAKGAGMICPNMATMLAVLTTNVNIGRGPLKKILKRSVDRSFNSITIDGDMSTNDTVFCLANGMKGKKIVSEDEEAAKKFAKALDHITKKLALMIVKDGEGTTKIIEISVKGVKGRRDAKKIALKIANSNLVKTALYGEDLNWGRIIASAGSAGVTFDPDRIDLWIQNIKILCGGKLKKPDTLNRARKLLEKETIYLTIDLKEGDEAATVWTSDLTEEYVRINSEYSS